MARALRRKRNTTRVTRAIESTRVNSTSCSEVRIVTERSAETSSLMVFGMEARRTGSAALIRSTVSMMFAPGWRVTWMMTPGLPLKTAALRTFSVESTTLATSPSRTGAPLV